MKKLKQLALLFLSIGSFSTVAQGQFTVGTKFACCKSVYNSTVGGGGCTTVTRTLRDRALTQADASARCAVKGSQMKWGTHSCPASSCSNSGSTPRVCSGSIRITNTASTSARFHFVQANGTKHGQHHLGAGLTSTYRGITAKPSRGSCARAFATMKLKWRIGRSDEANLSVRLNNPVTLYDYKENGRTTGIYTSPIGH